MFIFEFFGSILGYLLWGLFYIFQNFGVSIILFTIIVKVILFPFSVKQQKSMAKTSRLQVKQREIQKKYANNKEKMNEEMQKLYQKEGVSPGGGCLTSLVPMFIMLGIFYSVAYPLTNTLHIDKEVVESAIKSISSYPGMSDLSVDGYYPQIKLISALSQNPEIIKDLFANYADKIAMFVDGFNFGGFNLLEVPKDHGFASVYILIPVLSFVSSIGAQIVTMKINGTGQQQNGCMNIMLYGMPLFSAYIAYSVPAAVGFYWICSSLFSLVQTLVMGKFYSPAKLIAKEEAQHVALLEQNEEKVEYTYAPKTSISKKNKKKK